jgi:protein tyrosine/serine phosphatase
MKILETIIFILSICIINSINLRTNEDNIVLKSEPIKDDGVSDFHTPLQLQYINNQNPESISLYARGKANLSRPLGNTLDFSEDVVKSSSYVLQYSSTKNFENDKTTTVRYLTERSYILKNLKLGEVIYYRGAVDENELENSVIHKLTVSSVPPRNLDIPSVDNARDIGGYKTSLVNGGVIKQGLYYRTARLNSLNEKGKKVIVEDLGIKREINLRSTDYDPNINGVEYHYIPIKDSNGRTRCEGYDNEYKKVFKLMSEADKYPIILHCKAGADRTGVMSFALLALLGADYQDIAKDYAFTSFGLQGIRDIKNSQFEIWMENLEKYGGNTMAEKCKSWLMSKGIEENVLETIREIFIDGYERKQGGSHKITIPDNFSSLSIDEKYNIVKQIVQGNLNNFALVKGYLTSTEYQIILRRYKLELKNKN